MRFPRAAGAWLSPREGENQVLTAAFVAGPFARGALPFAGEPLLEYTGDSGIYVHLLGDFQPGAFTILIAEDDPPIRLLLKTILQRAGYLTAEARTGEEALGRIREFNVDILLLDLMMPGLNGFDVLDQLRVERPELLRQVMIVTAASDRDIARLKREDVCHVLRKPFDFRELLTLLEECCRGLSPRNSSAL